MTLPRGMSSGRGRGYSKACPPKPGAVVEAKVRKPLVSRGELARKPAKAGGGSTLKAGKRRVKPGGPDAGARWRAACLERNAAEHDGYPADEVTGELLTPSWECHHVVEATLILAVGRQIEDAGLDLARLLWAPANGMCLNQRTHERHTNAVQAIPRSALRQHHWDFAAGLDAVMGNQGFTMRLERDYPEMEAT